MLETFYHKMLSISDNCPHMELSVQLWTPTGFNHRAPTLPGISGRISDRASRVQEKLSPTPHGPTQPSVRGVQAETFAQALVQSFYPEGSQKSGLSYRSLPLGTFRMKWDLTSLFQTKHGHLRASGL